MSNIGNLVTPDEYIDHYGNQLKDDLSVKNLNINKLGFVGYLLNIIGNTQYDTKQYFDSLFREAMPVTALNRANLYFWADVYKYEIELANPAIISGLFHLQLTALPQANFTTVISKREITFTNIIFKIGNLQFTLDSSYAIVTNDGLTYTAQIIDQQSNIKLLSFTQANPKIAVIELLQKEEIEFSFSVPIYPYGTHYKYVTQVDRNRISSVEIAVDGINYSISSTKQITGSTDEIIFVTYNEDELIIETGSGINGKYIPQTEIDVKIILTDGINGNISSQTTAPISGDVYIKDYLTPTGTITQSISAKLFIRLEVLQGSGGKNTSTETEIQQQLTKHIQSRSNLISELDFDNILANDNGFLLFKKLNLVDNSIYFFNLLTDKYKVPIQTTCITVRNAEIIPIVYNTSLGDIKYLDNPEFKDSDELYVSPFIYKYDNLLENYDAYILYTNIVAAFNEIKLVEDSEILAFPANIKFELKTNGTLITFSSFTNLYKCNYTFKINMPKLDIHNVPMTFIDSSSLTYLYEDKFFFDPVSIRIDVYDNSLVKIIEYYLNDFLLMINITDFLSIKKFTYNTTDYLLSFPVIEKAVFDLDPNYYRNQIYNFLITQQLLAGNRMISDDIQGRFLNTSIIKSNILKYLTVQEYEGIQSTVYYSYFGEPADPSVDTYVQYTTVNPHVNNNGITVRTIITSGVSTVADVDITITGSISDIIISIEYNTTPDAMTATQYVAALNAGISGTYSGKNITITDSNYLLDNLACVGGGTDSIIVGHDEDVIDILDDGTTSDIKLPLKFNLSLLQNSDIQQVITNDVNTMRIEIASELKTKYTGNKITFYDTMLSTIIKKYLWVKNFTITITDSAIPAYVITSGLETIDQRDIFNYISKFDSAKYTPIYFYWDLNNIKITVV